MSNDATAIDLLKKLSQRPVNEIVKIDDYSGHPTFKKDQLILKMRGLIDAKYELTDEGRALLASWPCKKD